MKYIDFMFTSKEKSQSFSSQSKIVPWWTNPTALNRTFTSSSVLTKSKIIPGFQVPYSERIKKEANINTMAVGAIIEPDQAEDIITNGRADLIAIGRELLADTQWVYKAATKFGLSNSKDFLPDSYSFFLSRRDDYLDRSAKPA